MSQLEQRILKRVRAAAGCTEVEIARALFGPLAVQQQVNATIRRLVIMRALRRNESARPYTYTLGPVAVTERTASVIAKPENAIERPEEAEASLGRQEPTREGLSEDEIKVVLRSWLEAQGYTARVAMGREHGIDIDARRGTERWIIEVKGPGSLQPMRVNYFISMLGEVLQRMDDPTARYSIALPDIQQFRRLWERLPELAKKRTTITAIFVDMSRRVAHSGASS